MKINVIPIAVLEVAGMLLTCRASGQPAGYAYGVQVTIQASQVSGSADLIDFPVLISMVDNDLRTVSNGGRVENVNGYDIIFTAGNCATVLDHAIESYTASTGAFRAWVRIPALSAFIDTDIHMYYGNDSVTSNPSSAAVWDSSYEGVWHFENNVSDATSNGNNLTNSNTTNTTSGKIGSARDVQNNSNINSSSSGQHLALSNGFFSGYSDFTFEGWVMLDRYQTNWERIFDFGSGTTSNFFFCPTTGTGTPAETRARITTSGSSSEQGPIISNSTAGTGVWTHWAVVLNSTTDVMTVYRNGSLYGSAGSVTLTPNSIEPTTANYFGRSQYSADHYFDGRFDEFRISSTARSADWIATAYNNQNSPEAFISVTTEYTAVDLCGTLPMELLRFEARLKKNMTVEISWATASETNNDYFSIERSRDGVFWTEVGTVPGQGNSHVPVEYTFVDKQPIPGVSNYRLIQTDFDGETTSSGIRTVNTPGDLGVAVYPNPASDRIFVRGATGIKLYSGTGELYRVPASKHTDVDILDVSSLPKGIYHLVLILGDKVQGVPIVIE